MTMSSGCFTTVRGPDRVALVEYKNVDHDPHSWHNWIVPVRRLNTIGGHGFTRTHGPAGTDFGERLC